MFNWPCQAPVAIVVRGFSSCGVRAAVVATGSLSGCGLWTPECAGSVVAELRLSSPDVTSDFSSPTRDLTHVPCSARLILNHWTSRKVPKAFVEFVTILLLFYVLVSWSGSLWDPSSLTRDQTHTPCPERRSLNHWSASKVPTLQFFKEIVIFYDQPR